ncbi:TIGR03086 family metal-binding protein [Nocardiopsis sp. MG754419]|uniref:TIGR03086 family metal-binding protein n=1 Tax=Nocardiopsis sp. MG754419 TaxID=2259865 RepID=UPI001BABB744|nr:TIGR03086 family metal-binding protein [Nocardiopsis sp. MG754419]MBR8743042.1 TIGR03086 family protein [Nocardiopsis sp. MG754419]
MTALIDLHGTAMDEFDRRVKGVRLTDWALPTPCADWDVHDLVDHLATEQLWVPHLLDGARVEDIGDRFDGDNLGEEPVATWSVAARESRTAWLAPSALQSRVHLSFGEAPAELYLWQMTFDLGVHAWDLARATGADEALDADLVDALYAWAGEQDLAASGVFAEPIPVSGDADTQTRLLALTGRQV